MCTRILSVNSSKEVRVDFSRPCMPSVNGFVRSPDYLPCGSSMRWRLVQTSSLWSHNLLEEMGVDAEATCPGQDQSSEVEELTDPHPTARTECLKPCRLFLEVWRCHFSICDFGILSFEHCASGWVVLMWFAILVARENQRASMQSQEKTPRRICLPSLGHYNLEGVNSTCI